MSRMLNVRVDDDLAEAIDAAAEDAGVSRSMWMREHLASAVHANGEVHPTRAVQLMSARPAGECVHPPMARRELPFSTMCTLCGERLTVR